MKFDVKLPKSYYKYADVALDDLDKKEEKELLSISLSTLIACKLEQLALKEEKPVQEVLKRILIEEGVLDEGDVTFSNRRKASSKFLGADCDELKDTGTTKLYRIQLSEYAKGKIIKKMLDLGFDLSFFVRKSMVRKREERPKFYHILKPSDIGL